MIIDNSKIGLKTGSRNLVWTNKDGTKIIPSCIAEDSDIKGKVIKYEVGNPDNIKSIYPLNRGIVTNIESQNLLRKILEHTGIPKYSNMVIAAPEAELEMGKNLLKDAIILSLSPAKDLALYPESFCGAVKKLGVDNSINTFFTSLNMGSTSTGIGVYAAGNRNVLTSFNDVSGCVVDERILTRLNNTYGSTITNILKIQQMKEKFNMKTDTSSYTPIDILIGTKQKTVSCTPEFYYELDNYAHKVADIFIKIFSSPDSNAFRYNMINSPVILTGGMSNIIGLPELIKKYIDSRTSANIDLQVVEHGEIAPAEGAYMLAEELFS